MTAAKIYKQVGAEQGRTALFVSLTRAVTGTPSATKRWTIARPTPPEAPATTARIFLNLRRQSEVTGK